MCHKQDKVAAHPRAPADELCARPNHDNTETDLVKSTSGSDNCARIPAYTQSNSKTDRSNNFDCQHYQTRKYKPVLNGGIPQYVIFHRLSHNFRIP